MCTELHGTWQPWRECLIVAEWFFFLLQLNKVQSLQPISCQNLFSFWYFTPLSSHSTISLFSVSQSFSLLYPFFLTFLYVFTVIPHHLAILFPFLWLIKSTPCFLSFWLSFCAKSSQSLPIQCHQFSAKYPISKLQQACVPFHVFLSKKKWNPKLSAVAAKQEAAGNLEK